MKFTFDKTKLYACFPMLKVQNTYRTRDFSVSKTMVTFTSGISGALLANSACGFRYVILGLLRAVVKEFHNSEPQNFVGSAETMEPTLTRLLLI